jgi:hypothetical protein
MKTILVSPQSADVNGLLDQARDEDLIVRTADGVEFLLSAIDDFDEEIVRTRRNEKLMTLLDERGSQSKTIPLEAVKQQLGLQ